MALADKIGLQVTFVSSVERGERNLSLQSLVRLAEGLGVDPGTLVEGLWPGPPEMSHPLCESDAPKWSKEDCTHEEPPAFARADHQEAG